MMACRHMCFCAQIMLPFLEGVLNLLRWREPENQLQFNFHTKQGLSKGNTGDLTYFLFLPLFRQLHLPCFLLASLAAFSCGIHVCHVLYLPLLRHSRLLRLLGVVRQCLVVLSRMPRRGACSRSDMHMRVKQHLRLSYFNVLLNAQGRSFIIVVSSSVEGHGIIMRTRQELLYYPHLIICRGAWNQPAHKIVFPSNSCMIHTN